VEDFSAVHKVLMSAGHRVAGAESPKLPVQQHVDDKIQALQQSPGGSTWKILAVQVKVFQSNSLLPR
jgi:hypothetical protein